MTTPPPVRDAATILLVRDIGGTPSVLMGQRQPGAVFMPNRYVFPGGAVEPGDAEAALSAPLPQPCRDRLDMDARSEVGGAALTAAAIRELFEETGLLLASPGEWPGTPPANWQTFAQTGLVPDPTKLRYFFRAVTPPERIRRFDARFFLASADDLWGDPDDFSNAADELSDLQWIPLQNARNFNLPFITQVVLAQLMAQLPDLSAPETVPFFDNGAEESLFRQLGGRAI